MVLWMFAKSVDKVLCGDAARLRACEEEGQTFIDYADFTILEVLINQEDRQEVTFFCKIWVFLNCSLPLINYTLTELPKGLRISFLITLKWSKMVLGEPRKQSDMRRGNTVN